MLGDKKLKVGYTEKSYNTNWSDIDNDIERSMLFSVIASTEQRSP